MIPIVIPLANPRTCDIEAIGITNTLGCPFPRLTLYINIHIHIYTYLLL